MKEYFFQLGKKLRKEAVFDAEKPEDFILFYESVCFRLYDLVKGIFWVLYANKISNVDYQYREKL